MSFVKYEEVVEAIRDDLGHLECPRLICPINKFCPTQYARLILPINIFTY